MDMDKALSIAREQINRHRKIAECAMGLDNDLVSDSHTEIAEALETLFEAAENG